jgi:hypothetical protein
MDSIVTSGPLSLAGITHSGDGGSGQKDSHVNWLVSTRSPKERIWTPPT